MSKQKTNDYVSGKSSSPVKRKVTRFPFCLVVIYCLGLSAVWGATEAVGQTSAPSNGVEEEAQRLAIQTLRNLGLKQQPTAANTNPVCGASTLEVSAGGRFLTISNKPIGDGTPIVAGIGGVARAIEWPNMSNFSEHWPIEDRAFQAKFISANRILVVPSQGDQPYLLEFRNLQADWFPVNSPINFDRLRSQPGVWRGFYSDFDLKSILPHTLLSQSQNQLTSLDSITSLRPSYTIDGLVSVTETRSGRLLVGSVAGGNLEVWFENDGFRFVGRVDNHVDRVGFPEPTFALTKSGKLALFDTGLLAILNHNSFEVRQTAMYSQPLVDATSGRISLLYGVDKLDEYDSKPNMQSHLINSELRKWVRSGWFLRSAAIDSASGRTVLLLNGGGRNDAAIVFLERDGKSKYAACSSASGSSSASGNRMAVRSSSPNPPSPEFRVKFEQLGDSNSRIGTWTIYPQVPVRATVMRIRGGPATTVRGQPLSSLEVDLLNRGVKLVRLDYSGSKQAGVEMYSRLKLNLRHSLKRDADIISRFVRRERSSLPLLQIAESFGALLSGQIIETSGNMIDATILVSPLGNWGAERHDLPATDRNSLVVQRTRNIQKLAFGAPNSNDSSTEELDQFAILIRNLAVSLCKGRNVQAYFGAFDTVTPSESWNYGCIAQIPKRIIPDATHGMSPQMQTEILSFVDGFLVPKPSE